MLKMGYMLIKWVTSEQASIVKACIEILTWVFHYNSIKVHIFPTYTRFYLLFQCHSHNSQSIDFKSTLGSKARWVHLRGDKASECSVCCALLFKKGMRNRLFTGADNDNKWKLSSEVEGGLEKKWGVDEVKYDNQQIGSNFPVNRLRVAEAVRWKEVY